MKNFIQPGDVLTLIAPDDVVSGQGVLVGSLFGIAAYNATNGQPVECKLVGVFELPKAAGAIEQGDAVYWDDGEGEVTTDDDGTVLIGAATEPALNAAPTVRVRLFGFPPAASLAALTAAVEALEITVADHEGRITTLEGET